MIKFIKKFTQTDFLIKLRNYLNIKPIVVNLKNIDSSYSISDSFAWRTDNSYKTTFHYSDILKNFFDIEDSSVIILIFNNKNELLKTIKNKKILRSNKFVIDKNLINGFEGYGLFYIFHESKNEIYSSIRNSCYTGFSFNNNLESFVHGNIMGGYKKINDDNNIQYGIVGKSFLKNNIYKIQKFFSDYDKVELFFANSTKQKINFLIGGNRFEIKTGESKIIDITSISEVEIKSNCYLIRPIVFLYRKNFIDVHHC